MAHYRAKKKFGQNFLVDEYYIEKIIKALQLKSCDRLVEIGPGLGALTHKILPQVKHLYAFEIDNELSEKLRKEFEQNTNFTIDNQDALKANLNPENVTTRIFGNLPYNISTPLLFHCFKHTHITDFHFMLQLEVAKRIAATPNQKIYGRLSIMAQYHSQTQLLFDVPPGAFRPQPKVTSCFIRLIPYKKPPYQANNYVLFRWLVKTAFMYRRKTLRQVFKSYIQETILKKCDIDPQARAENLYIEHYVNLSNYLDEHKLLAHKAMT